ncbi:nitrate high affinity transporter [Tribonema minus]|uniref:Nitrate high affinity transporter n=1 Tax=Tribonema minus TaxID=303371 RepID=A0A836CM93_9STRA|nr:nitrate high affinity transporter [Tribonema minus]
MASAAEPSTTWQKYETYSLPTDPKQGDRATVLRLRNGRRPHMQTFWVSTLAWFAAFTAWFSFAPLMPEVKKDLGLSTSDVYNANISAVSATLVARLVVGPLADALGARTTFSLLLAAGSVPVFCSGLVDSAGSLALVRFFIGVLGACFVCNQILASQMFSREVIGTASAVSGGWGNLGGGVCQIAMVLIWSGLKQGLPHETAWRVSFIFPAAFVLIMSVVVLTRCDDSPKGQYKELIAHGAMVRKSSAKAASQGYRDYNSWILTIHYAACLGVELTTLNTCATYFDDKFGLGTTKAGLIATVFGLMQIFTRASGGLLSDSAFKHFGGGSTGMRGRIIVQMCTLTAEGVCLVIFSRMNSLGSAIALLTSFAVGVQMSEGSTFGIVPSVCPEATGAVSGIVGAGGNLGAIAFGLLFRFGPSAPETCFLLLGFIVLGCAALTPLLRLKGHDGMFTRAKVEEPGAIDII